MQLKPLDEAVSQEAVSQTSVASQSTAVSRLLPQAASAREMASQAAAGGAAQIFRSDTAARRFRRELAWIDTLPGLGRTAASLLAAHAVACMMALQPRDYCAQPEGANLSGLASVCPDPDTLEEIAAALLQDADRPRALSAEDLRLINALWPLTAPTEHLLASGGDDRLSLDPVTGLNKYGCTPWPRPALISFGSCTASCLSEGAFGAAERARRALVASALVTSPATALAEASDAIGTALLRHFGVENLAEAVLAASGTDAALVVTGLLAAEHPGERLTSILVSPSETGSGVPDAVQGRHFASCAPSGSLVGKGQPIDGLAAGPALLAVRLRDDAGAPIPAATVEADFEAAIRTGLATGRVVLHAIDGSKTGLTAPDRWACRRLSHTYSPKLDIVIDACQARIEPALVRWYLQQGFPVLVTGSKFFAAPGFCGAVLFPRARLQRITRAGRLPAGLAAYARLQGGFGSRRCAGLILRWTAALHEMAIFGHMPAALVAARLDRLNHAISAGIGKNTSLGMVAAPRPPGLGWSDRRSIFTFTVKGSAGLMSPAELRGIYRLMGEDGSGAVTGRGGICQIGQPVDLGGSGLGGLRIAISAAQIASGEGCTGGLGLVFEKLRNLLDAHAASETRSEKLL